MKRLLIFIAIIFIAEVASGQDGILPSLNRLQGTWQGSNDEGTFGYFLIRNNNCLFIIKGEADSDASIFSRPFGYLGFWDKETLEPEKVSDLATEGRKLLLFEFEGYSFDSKGNLDTPTRTCFITMNENEPSSDTIPKYFHLSCGGRPDIYSKIDYLPASVLESLRNDSADWKKYEDFVTKMGSSKAKVAVEKTYLFSEPGVTTKMYLIEGDQVEVLEKTNDWLLVRFFGTRIIDCWVKESDLVKIN